MVTGGVPVMHFFRLEFDDYSLHSAMKHTTILCPSWILSRTTCLCILVQKQL